MGLRRPLKPAPSSNAPSEAHAEPRHQQEMVPAAGRGKHHAARLRISANSPARPGFPKRHSFWMRLKAPTGPRQSRGKRQKPASRDWLRPDAGPIAGRQNFPQSLSFTGKLLPNGSKVLRNFSPWSLRLEAWIFAMTGIWPSNYGPWPVRSTNPMKSRPFHSVLQKGLTGWPWRSKICGSACFRALDWSNAGPGQAFVPMAAA